MNVPEVIEFLREKIKEVRKLEKLPYTNQEVILWRNSIEYVLEDVFGRDSLEYKHFYETRAKWSGLSKAQRQRKYRRQLTRRKIEILSIIQKYDKGGFKAEMENVVTLPPKAFIAHGGRSGVLDKLREFIEALGIEPVIVELSPSKGMTVDAKVDKYIKDADCGIVLATKGGVVDTKEANPKQHPRLNVIDELERLRAAFPEKTILLLERGVDLPSNVSGLTYEPFVGQSMDRAFTAIARELTAFGILKAAKP